ncbi:hypothetical protein RJG79_04605 [Mycoplasmatota bacterium WC44]
MKKILSLLLVLILMGCSDSGVKLDREYDSIDLNDNGIIELGESLFIDEHALTFISSSVLDASDNEFARDEYLVKVDIHMKNYGPDNVDFWYKGDSNKFLHADEYIIIKDPDGKVVNPYYFSSLYWAQVHLNTASSYTDLQFGYTKDGVYTILFDEEFEVEITVRKDEIIHPKELSQEFMLEPFIYNYNNVNVNFGDKIQLNKYEQLYITFIDYDVEDFIEIKIAVENKGDEVSNFYVTRLNGYSYDGVKTLLDINEYNLEYSSITSIEVPPHESVEASLFMAYEEDGEYTIMENDGFPEYIKINIPVCKEG